MSKILSKNRGTNETTGISPQRTQRRKIIYKNSSPSVVEFPPFVGTGQEIGVV
jgi:hypothetical protein